MTRIEKIGIITKRVKPEFKKLGPKYGSKMNNIAKELSCLDQDAINKMEYEGKIILNMEGKDTEILLEEVEIFSQDIPGWLVENKGEFTVALDISLTESLKEEGIARELINRVQNIRKQKNFKVTDRISIKIERKDWLEQAIYKHKEYICSEILAENLSLSEEIKNPLYTDINESEVKLEIEKHK